MISRLNRVGVVVDGLVVLVLVLLVLPIVVVDGLVLRLISLFITRRTGTYRTRKKKFPPRRVFGYFLYEIMRFT